MSPILTTSGRSFTEGCVRSTGRRRLLRLLGRLRATEVPQHAQLLNAATARDPALAAAFLAALPWALDPKPSTQWLAAATLTGQIVEHAAGMRSVSQSSVVGTDDPTVPQRGAPPGATLGLAARARRGQGPPALDSGTVRSALRRVAPPALSKVGPS